MEKMTRDEAINELKCAIDLINQDGKDWLDERDIPLLQMAIEALERKRGEWVYREIFIDENGKGHIGKYFCSVCGSMELHDSNYCSNCGADMRDEKGE